jgi:hypothetical protein
MVLSGTATAKSGETGAIDYVNKGIRETLTSKVTAGGTNSLLLPFSLLSHCSMGKVTVFCIVSDFQQFSCFA